MNVIVAAKLNQSKLCKMLTPLIEMENVERIYLVRRFPVEIKKVICVCPPKILRHFQITSEVCRFFIIIYLSLFKNISYLIGIHFYCHCIFVGLAGILTRKPFIFSIIEDPSLYSDGKVFSFFTKKAKHVFVRGSFSKKYLIDCIRLKENAVGVLPDVYTVCNQPDVQKIYDFVFVGDLVREKRIDVLLNVMAQVKRDYPDVRVAIVGRGPLKEKLIQQMLDLKLEKNVDFLGFVEDVKAVLNQSRVFIMTSETEGLPMVLYEAMSCALPLIVPDVGDIRDIALDQKNALVVPKVDVGQFALACSKILKDNTLYAQLTHGMIALRKQKQKELSLDNILELWSNVLK